MYHVCLCFQVYDMTTYLPDHPGGEAMLRVAGTNVTEGFHMTAAHKYVKEQIKQILGERCIGEVPATSNEDKK